MQRAMLLMPINIVCKLLNTFKSSIANLTHGLKFLIEVEFFWRKIFYIFFSLKIYSVVRVFLSFQQY